nr:uncharacterized protein LOC112792309 [Arachis hypogaea]
MCDFTMRNNLKEFHLYFEHGVDIPVVTDDEPVVEEVDSEDEDVLVVTGSEKSSSFSYDLYESAEDEAYKPPPSGYETESSDDSVHVQRKKKKNSKSGSPKTMAKRRASRRYTGKRRRKHVLNREMEIGPSSGDSVLGQGPGSGGCLGPDLGNMDGPDSVGNAGQKGAATEGGEEGVDGADIVYEYESEGFVTPVSSDDERGPSGPDFTEGKRFGEVQFRLGMHFATMEQFKRALKDVFVQDGRDCMYLKNEPGRVRAACAEEDCPWLIFVSKNSVTMSFEVKTFHSKHTCGRDYGRNLVDKNWVAKKLGLRLKTQPKLTPKEAMQHMKEDYNVQLNRKMITRAIKQARETVLGSEGAQFEKLRDYLNEIHKSNPGSTAHMNTLPHPQGPNLFQRLYISFDACKRGFRNGCRPLIGLDGCFLKGYYGGQLLSAVTQDANNHVFVIAFGVTRVENTDNWKWFLTCLQEDFGGSMLFGWHLMSDQQKVSYVATRIAFTIVSF